MENYSSLNNIIEDLTKNFTTNIFNEIAKFQIENDLIQENNLLKSEILRLNSDIQLQKSRNADLLLENNSQVNDLKKLEAESEFLNTEITNYHSEFLKLQSEIDELKKINLHVVELLSINRDLENEKKSILEELKKLNEQMQLYKGYKKQQKRIALNPKESIKLELDSMKQCIKEFDDFRNFMVSANNALTDENNKFKKDSNEKDSDIIRQSCKIRELEQTISLEKNKIRELEQIIIVEKNKFRELENSFVSYQNQVFENHMSSMIEDYSKYF